MSFDAGSTSRKVTAILRHAPAQYSSIISTGRRLRTTQVTRMQSKTMSALPGIASRLDSAAASAENSSVPISLSLPLCARGDGVGRFLTCARGSSNEDLSVIAPSCSHPTPAVEARVCRVPYGHFIQADGFDGLRTEEAKAEEDVSIWPRQTNAHLRRRLS